MEPKVGKGKGKTPGSGRVAGTPNKKTVEAMVRAEELGIDPFEILLLFAAGDWEALGLSPTRTMTSGAGGTYEVDTISPELRQKSAHDACKYLLPQRKAMEMSTNEGMGFKVVIEDYSSKK